MRTSYRRKSCLEIGGSCWSHLKMILSKALNEVTYQRWFYLCSRGLGLKPLTKDDSIFVVKDCGWSHLPKMILSLWSRALVEATGTPLTLILALALTGLISASFPVHVITACSFWMLSKEWNKKEENKWSLRAPFECCRRDQLTSKTFFSFFLVSHAL